MPLLDSTLAQVVFAFVMIGLFALILRWTFGRGVGAPTPPSTSSSPSASADEAFAATPGDAAPTERAAGPAPEIEVFADAAHPEPAPAVEDYGLLAPAAIVDTEEQAARVRALLGAAAIRATTTIGADGRRRVLVFARDLDRARRVAGSSN